jgi:hypothetical protein
MSPPRAYVLDPPERQSFHRPGGLLPRSVCSLAADFRALVDDLCRPHAVIRRDQLGPLARGGLTGEQVEERLTGHNGALTLG